MGLIYKEKDEITYQCDVIKHEGSDHLFLMFTCDGGKFGTSEIVDEYEIDAISLLKILQHYFKN